MEERARIIDQKDGKLVLETIEKEECSDCATCRRGKLRKTVLRVEDAEEYEVGQEVILYMDSSRMMRLYLFLYGVPLGMFLIGSLGSFYLLGGAARAFAFGVIFTALAYVLVARYIKKSGSVKPEIRSLTRRA